MIALRSARLEVRILAGRPAEADAGDARLDEEVDEAIEGGESRSARPRGSAWRPRQRGPRSPAIAVVDIGHLERHAQRALHDARRSRRCVMRPKFAEFWLMFGFPRFTQLNTLNASMRTCIFVLPPVANVLCRPEIDVLRSRSAQAVAPRVAKRPQRVRGVAPTCRTSAGSSPELDDRSAASGSPEMSARCPPVPVRALSTPLVTLKPPPLCMARMPVSDQSLSTPRARIVELAGNLPEGRRHEAVTAIGVRVAPVELEVEGVGLRRAGLFGLAGVILVLRRACSWSAPRSACSSACRA